MVSIVCTGLLNDAREAAGTPAAERIAARTEGLPLDPADLRPKLAEANDENEAHARHKVHALWLALPEPERSADGDIMERLRNPARTERGSFGSTGLS